LAASAVLVVLDVLGFLLVDAADVADHVRGHLAQRILAEQARLHLDAGEAEALGREARDLVVGQAGADRHAGEVARLFQQALEALAVLRLDRDQLGQLVDHRVQVGLSFDGVISSV
jgi:hypothetical protein